MVTGQGSKGNYGSQESQCTRSRSYLFTKNNYSEEDIEYLRREVSANCRYVIWGKELAPSTGTPHLQGFIVFENKKSLAQLRSLLPGCHLTLVKVDNGCAKYSTKDGDYEEYGDRPLTHKEKSSKGTAGIVCKWKVARTLAKQGRIDEIDDELAIKYDATFRRIAAYSTVVEPMDFVPGGSPKYRWQEKLMAYLENDPHPRHILWLYDTEGNVGKSEMATYLARNHGAFVTGNAKSADIAHAFKLNKIVVFDLSRNTDLEKVNYGVIEDLKNGRIFSPKYESTVRFFPKPHVIVFANGECPPSRFSADRLLVKDLNEELLFIAPTDRSGVFTCAYVPVSSTYAPGFIPYVDLKDKK